MKKSTLGMQSLSIDDLHGLRESSPARFQIHFAASPKTT